MRPWFEYDETVHADVRLRADQGAEIPAEMAHAFAMLSIAHALGTMTEAIYDLGEKVQSLKK